MKSDALRRVVMALGGAAALSACAGGPADKPAGDPSPGALILAPEQLAKVKVEAVEPAAFRPGVETTGTVAFDADRATQVIAPISGPVARLLVRVGARVKKDQPLADVSSPDFAAAVGEFRKGEAAARNARRIADQDAELLKNDAIARREAEQAEADATGAEADRDAALQQLRSLGVDDATLEDIRQGRPVKAAGGEIRSPVDGTVVEKLITPGQLLQAGATPCFTVADLSSVWVMADIFESSLPYVSVGDPAEITMGAAREPIAGTVDYISALVDPNTRAISVRIVARNPGDALKKDMYVRVRIRPKRDSTGILLPASAVLRDDENLPFVYVQRADKGFARRHVTLGRQMEQSYQIRDGLSAGERVAMEGGLFMQFAETQ
jgi:membrane fusion protein, heavy metal efflux system